MGKELKESKEGGREGRTICSDLTDDLTASILAIFHGEAHDRITLLMKRGKRM